MFHTLVLQQLHTFPPSQWYYYSDCEICLPQQSSQQSSNDKVHDHEKYVFKNDFLPIFYR